MPPSNQHIDAEDFRRLEGEVLDMKQLMGQMTTTLTRLALLEERQQGVSGVASKILEQVEEIRKGQHSTELRFASFGDLVGRVQRLEDSVREQHLADQSYKAAQTATIRTIRLTVGSLWAVLVVTFGIAMKLWGA